MLERLWSVSMKAFILKGFRDCALGSNLPLTPPKTYNPNHILITSEWVGFTFYIS